MGAYNITTNLGVSTVFTSDAAYIHSSFDRTGITTQHNVSIEPSDMSSGTTYGWRFGSSVAVGYGKLVVGAPDFHPTSGSGQDDYGKFYSYDLDGSSGTLILTGTNIGQSVGEDVAIGCGRIVVSCPQNFFNGYTYDPEVKIYKLDNTLVSTKTGSKSTYSGWAVAVEDNFIAITEPYYDNYQGAVHLYDLDGSFYKTITRSDQQTIGPASDIPFFANSVAMDHGKIVVGCRADDIDGNDRQGSVYIYDRFGVELKKIVASDGADSDLFGWDVAIGCGKIVVSNQTGSVYVYNLSGDGEIKITSPNGGGGSDQFGDSVAVGNGIIAVGAPYDDTVTGYLNYPQGAVYLYDLKGNYIKKLTPTGPPASTGWAHFGWSVSIGNNVIAVGAPGDTGGAGSDNDGNVYLFNIPEDSNTYWENMLETFRYDRRYK